MIASALSIAERIDAVIEAELAEAKAADDIALHRTAEAFQQARCKPREITVNFSGGIIQKCWNVTRGDGDYRVIYLPTAGNFSLCAESVFGSIDTGVHRPSLGCFGLV